MADITRTSAIIHSSPGSRILRRLGRNLLCALATGYILFVFSERLFWTAWRPDDSLVDQVVTWLAYCAIAYLFLAVVAWSRANDFWSVFLAGAFYGWVVEGGLIHTLYGTEPSAPFPVSISITGLSWHASISVMVGWWATGRALTASRPRQLVWISLAIGIFWGLWAMFLLRETPPIVTPVPVFLANAAVLTLGLMASWWVSFRAGVREFRPGGFGVVLCTLAVCVFYAQHVRMLGVLPLVVFPVVLSLAFVPLYLHRQRAKLSSASSLFSGSFHTDRLPIMGLIPCVAPVVYCFAAASRMDRLPINMIVYYVLTGPIGFLLLILAIFVSIRRVRA
jgi:hypothetical protein